MPLRSKQKQPTNTPRGLTARERAELADELSAYMDLYPVRTGVIAPRRRWSVFPRFVGAGFALMALVTMTISESSLPTDSLYSVKTNINERMLRAATYFSPVLRAEAEHTVYARRLSEAEQLMLLSQFNDDTASAVQTAIDEHAAALDTSLARAAATGDTKDTAELTEEVTETKEKYDPVLDILELRKRVPDPSVVDAVITDVVAAYQGSIKTDAVPDVFGRIKDQVMRTYAEHVLAELTTIDKSIASSTATTTDIAPQVSELLATSNNARAQAEAALRAGDPETALSHLDAATTAAQAALRALTNQS